MRKKREEVITLEKSVEVYGNIAITDCITEGVTKKFPINLEYYKIHNNVPQNDEKPYGIGIIKTHQDEVETIMEKSEFSHIFSQEKEADNMLELLIENEINIVQMPCAESTFKNNLVRQPMGIKRYDTKEFNAHCEQLAYDIANQIETICRNGYRVLAIMGIEQSPSCCVNYIYTNKGMEKRMGLFMEKLYSKIKEYKIPIIGINRKHIRKSLEELKSVIEKNANS